MKYSIITTSYNYGIYLEETIISVLNQNFRDFEYIIIDDGSTDNSETIIKKFASKDTRIKYLFHPNHQNKGLKESLKLALKHCRGKYVSFLESDDYWEPNRLFEIDRIIKNFPDTLLVFNDVNLLPENFLPNSYILHSKKSREVLNQIKITRKDITDFNLIPTFSCVTVKTEALLYCSFEAALEPCLDWFLWTQLLLLNKTVYLDKKLTIWRIHENSYISKYKDPDYLMHKSIIKLLYNSGKPSIFQKALNNNKEIKVRKCS